MCDKKQSQIHTRITCKQSFLNTVNNLGVYIVNPFYDPSFVSNSRLPNVEFSEFCHLNISVCPFSFQLLYFIMHLQSEWITISCHDNNDNVELYSYVIVSFRFHIPHKVSVHSVAIKQSHI